MAPRGTLFTSCGRPPSSSGPGYLVLSQAAGVRIPVGAPRDCPRNCEDAASIPLTLEEDYRIAWSGNLALGRSPKSHAPSYIPVATLTRVVSPSISLIGKRQVQHGKCPGGVDDVDTATGRKRAQNLRTRAAKSRLRDATCASCGASEPEDLGVPHKPGTL